jgi:hypothetical protein
MTENVTVTVDPVDPGVEPEPSSPTDDGTKHVTHGMYRPQGGFSFAPRLSAGQQRARMIRAIRRGRIEELRKWEKARRKLVGFSKHESTQDLLNQSGLFRDVEKNPVFPLEDATLPWTPYRLTPELEFLNRQMLPRDKNNMYFLAHLDNITSMVIELFVAVIIGDGPKFTVTEPPEGAEEESFEDFDAATKDLLDWFSTCGGEGRGLNDYILPWWITDNWIQGHSVSFLLKNKIEGWLLKPLDALSYAIKVHGITGQRGVVQYVNIQTNLPPPDKFESWVPGWYSPVGHSSITGFRQLPLGQPLAIENTEIIDLVRTPPMWRAAQWITDKLYMRKYFKRYAESYSSPIPKMTIPRNPRLQDDDLDFMDMVSETTDRLADVRNDDAFGVPGSIRDANGNLLADPWELELITPKTVYDFANNINFYNAQIAFSLLTPMNLIQAEGTQAAVTKLVQTLQSTVSKKIRTALNAPLKRIAVKILTIFGYKGITSRQIKIKWTKMREEDAPAWAAMLSSLLLAGAMDRSEVRKELARIDVNVPPEVELDMTPGEVKGIDMGLLDPLAVEEGRPDVYLPDAFGTPMGSTSPSADSDRKVEGADKAPKTTASRTKITGPRKNIEAPKPSQAETAGRTKAGAPGKGTAGGSFRRTKEGFTFVRGTDIDKFEVTHLSNELLEILGVDPDSIESE